MKKEEKLKNKNGNDLFKKPIYIDGNKNNIDIECALQWNSMYSEDVYPYTNNIFQKDGGTHLLGFRSALTRVINKYANDLNLLKKINYLYLVMMLKRDLLVFYLLKFLTQNFHLKQRIN